MIANRVPPSSASPWVVRFADAIPRAGRVLDVACGGGRHSRLMLQLGHPVTAVDRDISGVRDLAGDRRVRLVEADLEAGPWPFGNSRFAGVIVANYLWRPLLPRIVASVAPGGVLIYDTFAAGQERYGHPQNPAFLLRPDELLDAVRGELVTLAYDYGLVHEPRPALRGRICARRPASRERWRAPGGQASGEASSGWVRPWMPASGPLQSPVH